MTAYEEDAYSTAFLVHVIPKCCGTCRYFDRHFEDSGCANPKQAEFDHLEQLAKKRPDYSPETYGAYGGISVHEGCLCDLWEPPPPISLN